ncbi:MAG: extracellular solute-binding protein [Ruminococcus sp.]|nr:extracellular solute-binding protein [Ruminococcus sp.]
MRNMKKFAAGAAAMLMALSVTACGDSSSSGNSGSDTSSAETTTTVEKKLDESQQQVIDDIANDSKPEDRKLENTNIKWFSFWDINPTSSEDKEIGVDLALFKSKYNGTIEYISTTWEKKFDDLAAAIMADDAPDFCGADDMDMFPKGAIKEMIEPIDDYVDFNSDLWKDIKSASDQFMYKGKHYVGISRVDPAYIWIYNKTVLEELGIEDPAEMYADGNWNWETMSEMCKNFVDPENDKYALDAWYYENALTESTGVPLVGMKDGEIVNNIEDPKIAKVQEMMFELQKNNVVYPKHENGWNVRGGKDKWGTGLASGLTLFYPIGFWAIEDAPSVTAPFGDISKGEVMFVPVPCDKDSDAQYIPSRVHGFCICKKAKNPEGVAAWLDCTRYAEADPKAKEITINQLKNDYGWTDEMIEMRDKIYAMAAEHPVFEFAAGVNSDVSSITDEIIKKTMHPSDPASWTETVQANKKALDTLIQRAQEQVADKKS